MKELKVLEDIIGLKFQYYNTINLNSSVTVTGPPDSNGPGTTGTEGTRDINTLNNTNNIKDINTSNNFSEENSTIQIAAPKVATVTKDTKDSTTTTNEDITAVGPDTVMGVIILNKYNIIIIYNKNEIKFYNINNIINTLQFNNLLFKLYFNNIINIITPVTVLAPTATDVNGTKDTTMGKGANDTFTEENLNEIAAVTKTGESSTFSMDTNSKGTEDIKEAPFGAVGEADPLGAAVGASTVTEDTVTDNILIELENELLIYNIKNLKIILKYKKIKKKLYKYKLINNLLIIIYENKLKIYKINQLIFFHQFNFNITFLSNFFQNYFILIDQYNHLYYLEISSVAVLGQTASNEPDINSNKDITVVPGTNTLTNSSSTNTSTKDTTGASTVTEENSNTRFAAPNLPTGPEGTRFETQSTTTTSEVTNTNTTTTNSTKDIDTIGASTVTEEKIPNEIAVVTKTGESGTFEDTTSKDIKASKGVGMDTKGAPTGADDDRVVYIEEDVVGASTVTGDTVMVKLMEIELKNYEDYKIISLYIYNNNIIISLYNNIDFLLLITKLSNNQLIILYYSFNELFIEYNNLGGNWDNSGNLEGNSGNLEGNLGNLQGNLENSENLVNSDVEDLEINYFLFEKWNILLIYSNKSISTLLITNNINLINFNTTPGKGANSTATECTGEKILNEIAAVTKTGESSTFTNSKDSEEVSKGAPFGASTDGTTDRGPHTVTEEYIIIKLYEGYNIESIEYEDYIKLILLYTNYENEIYRKNSLADTPTIKNPNVIFTLQNSNSLSIYFIDIYFGYNFTNHILSPSVTVLGPTESITPGKGANSTLMECTPGKGANFTATECTSEKNLNEIAAVTKIGESDTFSENITSKDIKASKVTNTRGLSTVTEEGVAVGASTVTDTVTEKLKYLYNNNVYKENIKLYESLLNILYNFDNNFDNFDSLDSTVENIENTAENMESMEISVENVDNTVENISLNKINEYIIIIKNLLNIQNNFNYILENNVTNNTNSTPGKGANFMGMECTMGKVTPLGRLLVGEPHSVTEELKKLVNKNINIKIEINEIKKLEEIIFYINQQLKFLYKKLFNIPLRCLVTTNSSSTTGKGANYTFTTPGKGANFTAIECTMGKRANFTAMECTQGKGANFTAMECNTKDSKDIGTVGMYTKVSPYGDNVAPFGTVGIGCRGTDTVTEELNEKLYNLINDIKLLYNKPLKINNNIKLYKFITLFNSPVTVTGPTASTAVPGTTNSTTTTTEVTDTKVNIITKDPTGAVGPSTVTEENSTPVIAAPKVGTTALTGPLGTRFESYSSTPTGKGANDTFSTTGKGANSTAIECTSGKNNNEIAVVTKSGESSTFSVDSKDTKGEGAGEVDPFGASTDGTTGRGPHTVTDTVTENIFGNMELNKELNNPILFNTQITQTKQLNNISIFSTFNNYQSLYDLANQFNTNTGTNTGFTGGFGNTVGNTSTGFTGGFTGSSTGFTGGFGNTGNTSNSGFTGFTGGFSNTKETPFGVKEVPFGVKESPFGTTGTTSKESPFGTTGTTTNGVVGRGPDTVTENIWTGIRKYDPLN
uniref:Uncharacterized protein n=1 Tax=Theileria annulata TaxID=5874 RepID=A0A3B0MKJ5_THEAN